VSILSWGELMPFRVTLKMLVGGLVILALSLIVNARRADLKRVGVHLITTVLLSLAVFIPQVLLYTKSGLFPRYYLPLMFSLTIILLFIYERGSKNGTAERILLTALLLWGSWANFDYAVESARSFAGEGHATTNALQAMTSRSAPDASILIAADPAIDFERSFSLKTYLNLVEHRKFVFIDTFRTRPLYEVYQEKLILDNARIFNGRMLSSLKNREGLQCLVIFPGAEPGFLVRESTWFHKELYDRVEYGGYFILYLRKPPEPRAS
jgi:hypothetical protein